MKSFKVIFIALIALILSSFLLSVLVSSFVSCSKKKQSDLKQGAWRGVMLIDKDNSSVELPFNFTYAKSTDGKLKIIITNAGEKISTDEISFAGDSVIIKMPVFKDEIRAKIVSSDSISGVYMHFGSKSKYGIPFYAAFGKTERFYGANKTPALDITGRWEATFQPGDSEEYKAVGEFYQKGNNLTGTFLTASGDYRFLEGAVSGNDVMLSCLDGAHSLLFTANISPDGKLQNGILVGGPTWKEKWIAFKNEKAELPDPDKQSAIKEGTEKIDFSFPDLKNNKVSLSDDKFKDKAVVIQLMGSWCPNCMDETRLFTELYPIYQPKGLEIIGLCFESKDYEESKQRIQRFSNQLNAKYEFLYAGEVGNKPLMQALPFMKEFKGYPTTIYLDKNHKVVKVFTGFSGPGTGMHYDKQKNDIVQMFDKLIEKKEL
jgi:thiol-disulfide isomerase/thioredoxin